MQDNTNTHHLQPLPAHSKCAWYNTQTCIRFYHYVLHLKCFLLSKPDEKRMVRVICLSQEWKTTILALKLEYFGPLRVQHNKALHLQGKHPVIDSLDLVHMILTLVCSFLRSFITWKSSGFFSFFSRSCFAFSETNVIHFLIAWSLVL